MLRCRAFIRFAHRSPASRPSPTTHRLQPWQARPIPPLCRFSSALPERQQDEDGDTVAQAQLTSKRRADDADYLDFLMESWNGSNNADLQPHRAQAATRVEAGRPDDQRRRGRRSTRGGNKKVIVKADDSGRSKQRREALRVSRRLGSAATDFIHLRSALRVSATYSSNWNTQYAKLSAFYHSRLPDAYLNGEQPTLDVSPDAQARINEVLDLMKDEAEHLITDSINKVAKKHGMLDRSIWMETAMWLLYHERRGLMRFLRATHAPLYPPINCVEDCLRFLAQHYSALPPFPGPLPPRSPPASFVIGAPHEDTPALENTFIAHNDSTRNVAGASSPSEDLTASSAPARQEDRFARQRQGFQDLIYTLQAVIDRETKEQLVLLSSTVRFMIPYCTKQQVSELWASIKLEKIRVTYNSMLHFVDYFAKHDAFERALDALLTAHAAGAKLSSVAFRKSCSTLVRRSSGHPDGLRTTLRLVESLVKMGLRLNQQHYNIIMLNAVEAGDINTLDQVYHAMLDQDIHPNEYTCAIRLKACKLDIDNATMLREVIESSVKNGDVRCNVLLANEILHCLAMHHSKNAPETAFSTLFTAFAQMFDARPLQRLGLKLPSTSIEAPSPKQAAKLQPDRHTVTIILLVYLPHVATPAEAVEIYARFRHLIDIGDPTMISCLQTPHISNAFLQRFAASKRTLLNAAQVVKDMQRDLPGICSAQPDIYTWSIFMHGFARRGEAKLAEQVLTYMRNKGMEPNHVTWSTLLSGHARSQDAEGLLDAIRRAADDGLQWNEWTHRGVARFRDKEKLRQILEKQRFEQSMDFTRELKGGLEEKLRLGQGKGEGGGVHAEPLTASAGDEGVHGG